MLKKISLYAAVASFAMVHASVAQRAGKSEEVAMTPVIGSPEQIMAVTNDFFEVDLQRGTTVPTQAMLTKIVTWLSRNFDLPAIHDHPRIQFAPAVGLAGMRYRGLLSDVRRENSIHDPAVLTAQRREVVAIYNDTEKTIYLADAWVGQTPAELSVVVHEMVHHLQNLGRLKYECPAAREKLAYRAQDEWLKRFGQDLETAFEVDMLTLLVTSSCIT